MNGRIVIDRSIVRQVGPYGERHRFTLQVGNETNRNTDYYKALTMTITAAVVAASERPPAAAVIYFNRCRSVFIAGNKKGAAERK